MKAVQVVKYGDAVEGIELREVPEPAAPKSGEAMVGVEFSPINFNDLMVVWGIYAWKPELPATMGNEGAGKVRIPKRTAAAAGLTFGRRQRRKDTPLRRCFLQYGFRALAPKWCLERSGR